MTTVDFLDKIRDLELIGKIKSPDKYKLGQYIVIYSDSMGKSYP